MLTSIRETGSGPSEQAARRMSGALLTPRERDVLRWLAEGKTVEITALLLGISPHTVGEHLKNIRRKLNTLNSAHSLAEAIRRGELNLHSPLPAGQGRGRAPDYESVRVMARQGGVTASFLAE